MGSNWKRKRSMTCPPSFRLSTVTAGQMAGFSIERLVHFLSLLEQNVEVTVRKAPRGRRRGTVRTRIAKKLDEIAG